MRSRFVRMYRIVAETREERIKSPTREGQLRGSQKGGKPSLSLLFVVRRSGGLDWAVDLLESRWMRYWPG